MAKYKTLETGLKGTDNCPRCGRAMKKSVLPAIHRKPGMVRLICSQAEHYCELIFYVS